jgi:hypothetical protein
MDEPSLNDNLFTEDVIQHLLAFMCLKDILSFSSTCKVYREVSLSCLVFDEMNIKFHDDPYRLQKMLSLFPKLQSLTIEGGGMVDFTTEISLSDSLNLTSLTFSDSPRLADKFLEILSRCSMCKMFFCSCLTEKLKSLSMRDVICDSKVVLGDFPKVLSSLSQLSFLLTRIHLTQEDLVALFNGCSLVSTFFLRFLPKTSFLTLIRPTCDAATRQYRKAGSL